MEKKITGISLKSQESEYMVPEGYIAEIVDGKVVVKKKESDDERIRKNCIHFLELLKALHADTSEIDECITYLEKQPRGQRPEDGAWSGEDEDNLMAVKTAVKDYFDEGYAEELCTWFESFSPKPNKEWRHYSWYFNMRFDYSALIRYDDNKEYEIVRAGNRPNREVNGEYIFLKDIALNSSWKPTEKQIQALQSAIAFLEMHKASVYDITPLKPLYEQLKKLM